LGSSSILTPRPGTAIPIRIFDNDLYLGFNALRLDDQIICSLCHYLAEVGQLMSLLP
jgi:hypothetical protein